MSLALRICQVEVRFSNSKYSLIKWNFASTLVENYHQFGGQLLRRTSNEFNGTNRCLFLC